MFLGILLGLCNSLMVCNEALLQGLCLPLQHSSSCLCLHQLIGELEKEEFVALLQIGVESEKSCTIKVITYNIQYAKHLQYLLNNGCYL